MVDREKSSTKSHRVLATGKWPYRLGVLMTSDSDKDSVSQKTKTDLVEEMLRRLISRGEIEPGQRLGQVELAARLGTSSTPVREAMKRLEAAGILQNLPYRGMRVAQVDAVDMQEIYLIRAALEGLAVEHATDHLSEAGLVELEDILEQISNVRAQRKTRPLQALNYQFHTSIYHASGLTRLIGIVDSLWPLFPWDSMWMLPGRAESSATEHDEIMAALRSRDGKAAGAAMRRHIENGAQALLRFKKGAAQDET